MSNRGFIFGVSTAHLHFDHLGKAIEEVATSGFRVIEFFSPETDTRINKYPFSYIREICTSYNIIPGYHAPYTGVYDMGFNLFESIKDKMELIARDILELQPSYVVIHIGTFLEKRELGLERFIIAFNDALLPALIEWKGFIGIENFTLCHEPNALGDRLEDFLYVFSQIKDPNVGFTLDFGHANVTGNLYMYIEKFGEKLVSTHINDNNGRDDEHLCIGDGNLDWNSALKLVTSKGFRGPHIMECANPNKALQEIKKMLSSGETNFNK